MRIFRSTRTGAACFMARVDVRREEKPDAHFADGARRIGRRKRDPDAQRFQQVGAAALARDRPVAVLGHVHAGARHHERRHGRNVECARAVAARAAGIEQRLARRCRASTGAAISRMARAKPTSSSTVSPFIRRAIRKAAICGWLASPPRMMCMAACASSGEQIAPFATSVPGRAEAT